jgi:hypothetical protein
VTTQREAGDTRRSRRDLLRTGGVAALVGLAAVLGRPFPASAQDEGRKDRKKRRDADDGGGGEPAPPSTTISTSRSPALEVTNSAKQGEGVAINGMSSSSEGTAGLFVASNDGTALHTRGRIQFADRSGIASATGGAEFVIPVPGGLREEAFVLATLQDHHEGVHVESASVLDTEEGLIVVRLNQALAEPAKVGWIVLG